MRRLWLISMILISSDIYACSCGGIGIFEGQRGSDFVFVGQVMRINEIITEDTITGMNSKVDYRRYEFVFKVTGVYKGRMFKQFTNEITIITTGGGSDCGSRFELNKKYLVYSYAYNKKLKSSLSDQDTDEFMTTSGCTRTKKIKPFAFFERFILRVT